MKPNILFIRLDQQIQTKLQQIGEEMGYTARWAQMKHRMALMAVERVLERG